MLLLTYLSLPLKQFIRIRMACFFTLILPVILYLLYGHTSQSILLIAFLNFTLQSAMLQSVGMFISAHKTTAWGSYVSTLPSPPLYPILGTVLGMFLIGLLGLLFIISLDLIFYHVLSSHEVGLVLIGTSLGAIPMGALGYLIGAGFDQMSARNILTFTNTIFLFAMFVPDSIQKILAYGFLPNIWLNFTWQLAIEKHFSLYDCTILLAYLALFIILIKKISHPKSQYT